MKRHGYRDDRIGERVAASLFTDELRPILDTLSEREERILALTMGLEDGQQLHPSEIAKEFGVTAERIRQIQSKVMSKMRHRSKPLRDYLDIEVLSAVLARPLPRTQLEQCPRHGWVPRSGTRCAVCPCRIQPQNYGRRREYCSDACRMVAYRARKRDGREK